MILETDRKNNILQKDPFSSPILAETDEKAIAALKAYTSLFWRPRYSSSIKINALKTRYFHIQAAPGGNFSPLIKKNPKLFKNIIHKVVNPGDFYNVSLFTSKYVILSQFYIYII